MMGPVDYMIVGFKGNNFDGSILKEIKKAVDSGVIRVIDLLLIVKDEAGGIEMAEVTDQADDIKQAAASLGFKGEQPLMTEEDAAKIGAMMENNTTAGALVVEELWAKAIKQALVDKHAILIGEGRLRDDNVNAAMNDLAIAV